MIENSRYIFVHVPKTAGQSIQAALGGRSTSMPLHTPLKCVDKGERFAFGFLRNPWARMVSLYHFMCQKDFKNTDNFDQAKIRRIGFKRWLMDDEFFMKQDGLPPGHAWSIKDTPREDLPPMQRRPCMWWLEGCDFIGQIESLESGLRYACKKAGIAYNAPPRINASRHKHYSYYYDDESRQFVADHFAPDIKQAGYVFENPGGL